MTTDQTAAPDITRNAGDTELWVERTGKRLYTGRNSRGAEVSIGGVEVDGAFSPGELLKIALAGCSGLSADSKLAHRLGDDVDVVIKVTGMASPERDRYRAFAEELVVDLSSLDPDARERLITVVHRAIDSHCTVGRSLDAGVSVQLTVTGER